MASPLRQSKPHKFITTQPGTSSESKKPQPSITSSEEGGGKRREGEKGLEVKKSQEEAVAIIRRGDTESEGSSVVDDLELTDDGLSTGEIPSDITFR